MALASQGFFFLQSGTICRKVLVYQAICGENTRRGMVENIEMMMASSDLDELKALIEKQEGPIPNTVAVGYFNKGLVFVHSQVECI